VGSGPCAAVKVVINKNKKKEARRSANKAQQILPNRLASVELHRFTSHSLFDCRKSFGFTARKKSLLQSFKFAVKNSFSSCLLPLSWRFAALAGKKARPHRAPHKSLQRLTVAMQVKDTDS
jgi:hypothetical protein